RAFAAGDRVFPAFVAEAMGEVAGDLVTDRAGRVAMELFEKLDQVLPAAMGEDWDDYLDVPLLASPLPDADWGAGVGDRAAFDQVRNAFGHGRREIVRRGGAERVSQSLQATLFNATEILRL